MPKQVNIEKIRGGKKHAPVGQHEVVEQTKRPLPHGLGSKIMVCDVSRAYLILLNLIRGFNVNCARDRTI